MEANTNEQCCPKFDPAPWDEKEIKWNEKLFLKDHFMSCMHIPLNLKQKILFNTKLIADAGAVSPDWLMLVDENSLWGADMYISVNKEIPNAKMVKITGTFLSKVFEGSFSNMGKWIKEMRDFVKSKGKEVNQLYFYYTTCPKCAKKYGKNYVVILARID